MELNREQIIKALECCTLEGCHNCRECPQGNVLLSLCKKNAMADALALIISQEQRIKELTSKIAKWEEECDLRGDMWCKLNEENKRLTEENERLKLACAHYSKELCDEANRTAEYFDKLEADNERLRAFKQYFDELYGTYLYIDGWHENGALEPFDNFYESALQEMKGE